MTKKANSTYNQSTSVLSVSTQQVYFSTSTLLFTPDNWGVGQEIAVAAEDDKLREGGLHTALISHNLVSEDMNYNGEWMGQDSCSNNITEFTHFMGAYVLVANNTRSVFNHPYKFEVFEDLHEIFF